MSGAEAVPRRRGAARRADRRPSVAAASRPCAGGDRFPRRGSEAVVGRYLEVVAAPSRRVEYYWHQLEGPARAGRGGVGARHHSRGLPRGWGRGLSLVDRTGGGELLVPAIRDVVRAIDLDAGSDDRAVRGRGDRLIPDADRRRHAVPRALRRAARHERDRPCPGTWSPRPSSSTTCASMDWARHRSVDDYPYGGGAGMVLRPEPLYAAIEPLRAAGATVVLLDPAGEPLTDALARALARESHLALVCGRYEGVDERARNLVDREVSIGDYVLTGGELPALVLIDAVARLVPGCHRGGVPRGGLVRDRPARAPALHATGGVPRLAGAARAALAVTMARCGAGVDAQALRRTRERRPDLLDRAPLTSADRAVLAEEPDAPEGSTSGCRTATILDFRP